MEQELSQICLTDAPVLVGSVATTVVTIASLLANFVKPDTFLGKVIHAFAINLKVKK